MRWMDNTIYNLLYVIECSYLRHIDISFGNRIRKVFLQQKMTFFYMVIKRHSHDFGQQVFFNLDNYNALVRHF